MIMHKVQSSTIAEIGHDPASSQLAILFHSGKEYTYDGLTGEEFEAFLKAPSIGKHFAGIRAKYKGVLKEHVAL